METVVNIPELAQLKITSKITHLGTDNFKLVDLSASQKSKFDKDKVVFEFTMQANINLPSKTITLKLLTKIFLDENKTQHIGTMNSTGVFEVVNIDDITKQFNGIPQGVMGMYMGVLLGTTRGMYITKIENTYLKDSMIPIVNIDGFFTPTPQHRAAK